jgi:isopentenyl-diphosphate delta-isomerase
MTEGHTTALRKLDHVRINLEESVQSAITTGLERFRLEHCALPEHDLDDVDPGTAFLGRSLGLPLLVSSMTGGASELKAINIRLAEAAQERRLAMGVGSQRAALEKEVPDDSFPVRSMCPDIPLLANLGAIQLNYGFTVDHCRRAVDMIEADALILHLNPLQEALQPGGNTRWSGLLAQVAGVVRALEVPVIVKEVGWGISGAVARSLADIGVRVIDVAGAGGTSWSEVEKHRAETDSQAAVAAAFAGWGIPTAESIKQVRAAAPEIGVIASGGIRNGVDVAIAIALGADLAGMAGPFLKAASVSTEAVIAHIDVVAETLRVAMFATGARRIQDLTRPGVLAPSPAARGG